MSASKTQKGYSKATIAVFVLLAAAFIGLAYAEYKYSAVSLATSFLIGNSSLAFGIIAGLSIIACAGFVYYLGFAKGVAEGKAAKIAKLEENVLKAEQRTQDWRDTLQTSRNQLAEAQEQLRVSYLAAPALSENYALAVTTQSAYVKDAEDNLSECEVAYSNAIKARDAALSS